MITVQITEHTPANMLRAVRAACNELLGEVNTADSLKAIALGWASTPAPVPTSGEANTAESLKEIALGEAVMPVPGVDIPGPDDMRASPDARIVSGVEVDSAGQPWDPEQHSSTRSKLQDGTWKKKRGAGRTLADAVADHEASTGQPLTAAPTNVDVLTQGFETPAAPVPPTPPAPPAAEVVTMNQIWALITNQTHTLDQVKAAAQAMGFADLGSVAQTATAEQRADLLAGLTEED